MVDLTRITSSLEGLSLPELPSPTPYDLLLLIIGVAVVGSILAIAPIRRVRLRAVLLFVVAGAIAGRFALDLEPLDDLDDLLWLERVSEFAVIVSLLVAGLKVGRPIGRDHWRSTVRLILFAMPLSIAAIALTGHYLLGLAIGPAILLGAVLAPTDPVTAGGVQLEDHADDEEMRFGITTEAGLNDGFAFPFVYLGILASQQPDAWGAWFGDWVWRDLVYRVVIALPLGWFIGSVGTRIYLERRDRQRLSMKRAVVFPVAMLIATYGFVEALGGYGFLASFTLGLSMRRAVDQRPEVLDDWVEFSASVEEVSGAALLFLLGALFSWPLVLSVGWPAFAFALVAILLIRPGIVLLSTVGGGFTKGERLMWSWFGARGIGSIYYLSYALGIGIPESGHVLFAVTTVTVLMSLVLHGATLSPALKRYDRRPVPM